MALCLLASLAGCAGQDAGPPEHVAHAGRPGGARRLHLPNVFISPAGKPFRAAPGEPYPVAAWFAAADTNHDGRLTREEFRADAEAFFRELDTNHDGVIDGSELANYEQNIAPEILPRVEGLRAGEGMNLNLTLGDERNTEAPRGEEGGRRGSGEGGGRAIRGEPTQGAALFSLVNEPEPVAAADTSFDGRITLQEFDAAADRRFDLLDTKQQGYLTLQELPKTPVQQALEHPGRLAGAP